MHSQLIQWLHEEARLPEQGSSEWFKIRKNIITASIVPDLLGTHMKLYECAKQRALAIDQVEIKIGRNYRTRQEVIQQKTNQKPATIKTASYILEKGQLCEHVIRDHLEKGHWQLNPLDIYMPLKFRIKDGWLGASPDGCFNSPLRMLEIKTLVYRKLEKNVIPHKYWIQMQIQMYVYGVVECEYAEARVEFIDTYGEWKYGNYEGDRGVVVRDVSGCIHTCPVNLSYDEWHDSVLVDLVNYGFQILYYHIPEAQILQISYDERWMHEHCLPRLQDTYKEILRILNVVEIPIVNPIQKRKEEHKNEEGPSRKKYKYKNKKIINYDFCDFKLTKNISDL